MRTMTQRLDLPPSSCTAAKASMISSPAEPINLVIAIRNAQERKIVRCFLAADKGISAREILTDNVVVELLADNEIDCVILDQDLGLESGLDVIKKVRARVSDPPSFIIYASTGNERTAVEAFHCGASDYISKGWLDQNELMKAVARCVNVRQTALLVKSNAEQLSHLSMYDQLTGLPNRNFLEEQLSNLIASAERHGKEFALLLLDINNFKDINDTFGHVIGDRALRGFAGKVKQASRASDIIGRFGGDEFVYLIDQAVSEVAVREACKRLSNALSFSLEFDNVGLKLSSSIGAAIYPTNGTTAAELLKAADEAAYMAKQSPQHGYALASEMPGALRSELPHARAAGLEAATIANHVVIAHRKDNRRAEHRQRVLKKGMILINDASTINCLVRDQSVGGARISVEREFAAPERFTLLIAGSGIRKLVEKRWQRGKEVGVCFMI